MSQNKYFEDLKEGLTAAIDYERGKFDLRSTKFEIPMPPPDLSKKKIKSHQNKEWQEDRLAQMFKI